MFVRLVVVGVVYIFAEGRAGLLFNPAKIEFSLEKILCKFAKNCST